VHKPLNEKSETLNWRASLDMTDRANDRKPQSKRRSK
jgi:hypothetical protein